MFLLRGGRRVSLWPSVGADTLRTAREDYGPCCIDVVRVPLLANLVCPVRFKDSEGEQANALHPALPFCHLLLKMGRRCERRGNRRAHCWPEPATRGPPAERVIESVRPVRAEQNIVTWLAVQLPVTGLQVRPSVGEVVRVNQRRARRTAE